MLTKIFSSQELFEAALLMRQGGLVAFPTETVYGLGAPIFSPGTIQKIYQVKGRPSDNPLIAHISSLSEVESIAMEVPDDFYMLAKNFFPGPLTIVLKRHPKVPDIVSAGMSTIAFRMPDHPMALELIRHLKEPIVAPSANISGRPSSTESAHVLEDFQGKIDGVVDGGPCRFGIESTVLSLVHDRPLILRPGSISRIELEKVLNKPVDIVLKKSSDHEKVASPGMKYRHYAPDASVKLFTSEEELLNYLSGCFGKKIMLLSSIEKKLLGCDHYFLNNNSLYAHLRNADRLKYDEVLVLCDRHCLEDHALMNRLLSAAELAL